MADMNPRVLRDQLVKWVGKKVTLGTTDFHYVSGVIQEVDGQQVRMSVKGNPVIIPTHMVATVVEAPAVQAEYVK